MTHCWQGINNERQDSAMQRGRRKVPCGGSLALCKDVRASPRPPGPHVQPLCALLLLPVWWERPDPLGNRPTAAPARVAQSWVGRGAAAFPAWRRVLGWRWPGRPEGTTRCRVRSPPVWRALAQQPEVRRGRREQVSVQHRVQLVGQVIEHVADVFQDVLG